MNEIALLNSQNKLCLNLALGATLVKSCNLSKQYFHDEKKISSVVGCPRDFSTLHDFTKNLHSCELNSE